MRSKGHLDFQKNKILLGGTLRTYYSIESYWQENFLQVEIQMVDVKENTC
jgi:hypothetical protein